MLPFFVSGFCPAQYLQQQNAIAVTGLESSLRFFQKNHICHKISKLREILVDTVNYKCLIVSHDQSLRTLFIVSITEHKHVPSTDGQKFPPWLKFRECRNLCGNFYCSWLANNIAKWGCPPLLSHKS